MREKFQNCIADKTKTFLDAIHHHKDPPGNFSVILDFMSKIRSFSNLASFGTFGHAIMDVLHAGNPICSRKSLHIVFDSYLESSIKSGERLCHEGGVGYVDLTELNAEVPVPQQLDIT